MNALYSLDMMVAMVLVVYLLWSITKPEETRDSPEPPEDGAERAKA